ncbi:hypothetical protein K9M47_04200 [Candidatus Gracilibacteria bacterium]|nr:hypothetical protein [Candidatus Gracilibacteria bacterium]MCF7898556.1 hypothetical protein [Candidatus Paceibacterota bacterium]
MSNEEDGEGGKSITDDEDFKEMVKKYRAESIDELKGMKRSSLDNYVNGSTSRSDKGNEHAMKDFMAVSKVLREKEVEAGVDSSDEE